MRISELGFAAPGASPDHSASGQARPANQLVESRGLHQPSAKLMKGDKSITTTKSATLEHRASGSEELGEPSRRRLVAAPPVLTLPTDERCPSPSSPVHDPPADPPTPAGRDAVRGPTEVDPRTSRAASSPRLHPPGHSRRVTPARFFADVFAAWTSRPRSASPVRVVCFEASLDRSERAQAR